MKRSIMYIALAALLLALCAWGAVLYGASEIRHLASKRAEQAIAAGREFDRTAYAQRIAALAADTEGDRMRLGELLQADIVTIIDIIEAAGKSARVTVRVSDALPAGGAEALPGGGELQAVEFIVQTTGTFSSLMQAATLFEQLPLPSSVQQIELERSTGEQSTVPWRMTTRIRVLTTALSS